jgi:hypothetical protein
MVEVGQVDLFIHDSLHTVGNMRFELETAWPRIREGGVVFVDDADCNDAFADFASSVGGPARLCSQGDRDGAFGLICRRT